MELASICSQKLKSLPVVALCIVSAHSGSTWWSCWGAERSSCLTRGMWPTYFSLCTRHWCLWLVHSCVSSSRRTIPSSAWNSNDAWGYLKAALSQRSQEIFSAPFLGREILRSAGGPGQVAPDPSSSRALVVICSPRDACRSWDGASGGHPRGNMQIRVVVQLLSPTTDNTVC